MKELSEKELKEKVNEGKETDKEVKPKKGKLFGDPYCELF